jgi:hypothetical protein
MGSQDPIVAKAIALGQQALASGTHTVQQLHDFLEQHAQSGTMTPQQTLAIKNALKAPTPQPQAQPIVDIPSAMGGAGILAGRAGKAISGAVDSAKQELNKDVTAAKRGVAGAEYMLGGPEVPPQ